MNTWFTVKAKYTKQLEDGRLKRVTEPYLVDAMSFTDAEARIYHELGQMVQGEFLITGIAKTDYADIFHYEDADDWYKCKLTYVSVDADSGKEKKVTNNFLVTANNIKEAYDRIHESLSEMMVTFEIPAINLTPIEEIFPYDPELEKVLGMTPMENIAENQEAYEEEQAIQQTEEEQEESEIIDNYSLQEDADEQSEQEAGFNEEESDENESEEDEEEKN